MMMGLDIDFGTAFMVVASIVGAFWGLVKLMFMQYEKRQEQRFTMLGDIVSEQKEELNAHMERQDTMLTEVRRVESTALTEIRRVENELSQCRIDAANRFMTKEDAKNRHQEILDAIKGLGTRIDSIVRVQ